MSSKKLFQDKTFFYYYWTQFFGALNDNIFKNALVVLIAFRGVTLFGLNKSLLVPLCGAIFILPFLLFSPISGQLSEKYEKSTIIRFVKIFEIGIMLLASLGFYLESYGLLLLVLFLMGTHSTIFGPIKFSILPDIVTQDHLLAANAYVESGTFVAILFGTILGGYFSSFTHAELYISLLVLVVAILGYFSSLKITSIPIAAPRLKIRYNPVPEIKEMYQIITEKKSVYYTLIGISWFWFFGAAILSVLPVYCQEDLKVGETVLTLFLAAFTLGIGIGSILCEKISKHRVNTLFIPISGAMMSLFLMDLSLIRPLIEITAEVQLDIPGFFSTISSYRLIIDFFLMSVSGGVFIVPLYTMMQERSPAHVRSRVVAANNIMNAIFMIIASVLIMIFYKIKLSHSVIYSILALMNLGVSGLAYIVRNKH